MKNSAQLLSEAFKALETLKKVGEDMTKEEIHQWNNDMWEGLQEENEQLKQQLEQAQAEIERLNHLDQSEEDAWNELTDKCERHRQALEEIRSDVKCTKSTCYCPTVDCIKDTIDQALEGSE